MDGLVRRAGSDERGTLRELLTAYLFEFDEETGPYRYFDAYWSEPERVPFVIELDRGIAGFCLIRLRGRDWTIAEFAIVPGRRRRGVGRRAVTAISKRALDAGASYVEATVHREKKEALAFWLACGFRVVEEGDLIVTRLNL